MEDGKVVLMTDITQMESESLAGADLAANVAGGAMMGFGLIGTVAAVRSRRWWALGIPMLLLGGGLAVIARGLLGTRRERIDSVESVVRDELDKLDPIARAQVLRDVVAEQMARVRGHAETEA